MDQKTPNILYTVRNDLCTGCGLCANVCPNDAVSISVSQGNFRPKVDSARCKNLKGCHRCFDSCPGVGINLVDEARNLLNDANTKEDQLIGRYSHCYVGYSNDIDLRFHSASGGCVSQFLIWLLENNKIDGAVVTKFEKNAPLMVKSFIARNREDVISAKGSKYSPTSMPDVVRLIKEAQGTRFIVVGVPCQVEGLRKILAVDKPLREKICGLFSVFCSGSRSFYFTEYVMKERKININDIEYLAYRDNGCLGGLVVKGPSVDYYEDYQSYCHPLRSIFIPRRCMLCVDHFGELSDISFGDIHVAPYDKDKVGVNSIVARNVYWNQLLKDAEAAGVLTLENLNPSVLIASQKMARVKKNRNASFAMFLKKMRKPVPEYGSNYEGHVSFKTLLNYFQIRLQQAVGRHKRLWPLIPLLKAKVNKR